MVYAGNQIAAIAAGSFGGVLLVVAITATIIIVCLALHKLKLCNVSRNQVVEKSIKSSDDNTAAVTNAACKSILPTLTINAEFGGITELQPTTVQLRDSKLDLDMEQNAVYGPSNGTRISNASSVASCNSGNPPDMDMEENVAYGSSTGAQISLTSNIAYVYTGKNPGEQFEESCGYFFFFCI